jgi:hypothetical protein
MHGQRKVAVTQSSLFDRSMIVAIDRVDKSCSPMADIALRKHFAVRVGPPTRHQTILDSSVCGGS